MAPKTSMRAMTKAEREKWDRDRRNHSAILGSSMRAQTPEEKRRTTGEDVLQQANRKMQKKPAENTTVITDILAKYRLEPKKTGTSGNRTSMRGMTPEEIKAWDKRQGHDAKSGSYRNQTPEEERRTTGEDALQQAFKKMGKGKQPPAKEKKSVVMPKPVVTAKPVSKPVTKPVSKPRTTTSRQSTQRSTTGGVPAGGMGLKPKYDLSNPHGLPSLPMLPEAKEYFANQANAAQGHIINGNEGDVVYGDPGISQVYPGGQEISQQQREAIIQQSIEQNLLPEIAQTVMNPVYSTQAPQPPPQGSAYGLGTEPIPLTPQEQYLQDYISAPDAAPFVPQPYVDTEVAQRPTWTPPEVYQDQPINKWAGIGALLAGLGGSPNIGVTAFKTLQGLNQEQNKLNLDRSQRLADSIKQKYLYEIADSDFQQGINDGKAKTKNLNVEAGNSAALKNLDAVAQGRKDKASVAGAMIDNDQNKAQLANKAQADAYDYHYKLRNLDAKIQQDEKDRVAAWVKSEISGETGQYSQFTKQGYADYLSGKISFEQLIARKNPYQSIVDITTQLKKAAFALDLRQESRAVLKDANQERHQTIAEGQADKRIGLQAGSLNLRTDVAKAEGKLGGDQPSLFPRKPGADITPKGASIPATLLPSGVSRAIPKGEKVMDGGSY